MGFNRLIKRIMGRSKLYQFLALSWMQKYNVIRFIRFRSKTIVVPRIIISPSYGCQLNCRHCYEEKKDSTVFLTTDEIKKVIDDFYETLYGYSVLFNGGEVLLREDIAELIRYSSKKGLYVAVVTNGLLLTDDKIKEMKTAGINRFIVSIDNSDETIHDDLRGKEGCYNRAWAGIRSSVKNGIDTVLWTYVSRFNDHDLAKIADMAEEAGVCEVKVYFPVLSGKLRKEDDITLLQREKYRDMVKNKRLVKFDLMREDSRCAGGREYFAVLPTGDVVPCVVVQSCSHGNIRRDNLKECFVKLRAECLSYNKQFTGQCMMSNPEYRKKYNLGEMSEQY